MNNNIVSVDTNIISCYLGLNQEDPKWNIEKMKAESLINDLRKNGFTLYIPSPVLLELFIILKTDEDRIDAIQLLKKDFFFYDFTFDAAQIGADLSLENNNFIKILNEEKISNISLRNHIRTDTQIISTAIASGSSTIYSNDKHFKTIANGRIDVKQLQDVTIQIPLPDC